MTTPAPFKVFDDTRGYGTCRSCGAKLVWYETLAKRRMPLERDAVAVQSEHVDGRLVLHFAAEDSHFVQCPDAARFRRRTR